MIQVAVRLCRMAKRGSASGSGRGRLIGKAVGRGVACRPPMRRRSRLSCVIADSYDTSGASHCPHSSAEVTSHPSNWHSSSPTDCPIRYHWRRFLFAPPPSSAPDAGTRATLPGRKRVRGWYPCRKRRRWVEILPEVSRPVCPSRNRMRWWMCMIPRDAFGAGMRVRKSLRICVCLLSVTTVPQEG